MTAGLPQVDPPAMTDSVGAVHPGDHAADQVLAPARDPVAVPFAASGLLAGFVGVLVFTAIHMVLISDILFMLVPMLVAGGLCGLLVAWSYALLVPQPSLGSWIRYNAAYLVLFVALGGASVVLFEPVATIPQLMATNGRPDALIGQAMPLTVAFVPVAAVLVTRLFGGGIRAFGPVLVAVAVLVFVLGLNVSLLGLVEVRAGELSLIAELFGLIAAIDAGFATAFLVLERRRLAG